MADTDASRQVETIAARFDRAAHSYELTGVEFFATFGDRLVELAAPRDGDRVLDLGCGTGAVLIPAARAVGPRGRVLGIDLAEGMVRRARAAVEAHGLTCVEVRVADAADPPVAADSFDQVLAGLVLFFLPDPAAALGAYRHALVPGGRLGFTTFGEQDPRFAPVFAAATVHVPQVADGSDTSTAARRAQQGPFASAASIDELLGEAGFDDVRHLEDHHEVRFEDPEQWIRWSWSHGMRELWESVPSDSLDEAQRDATEVLDGLRGPDGLTQHWVVRTTLARAPSS